MLHNPTIEKLHELRLFAMAQGLKEQRQSRQYDTLGFEERLALATQFAITSIDGHLVREIQIDMQAVGKYTLNVPRRG